MPRLVSSTASDTNHGVQDLIPNFLIKSTYTSGLNMWTTSPKKNKRPEPPLADQILDKVGFSTTMTGGRGVGWSLFIHMGSNVIFAFWPNLFKAATALPSRLLDTNPFFPSRSLDATL
uniref:Uncharacterized protein n=1 Tax=Arundo donax TaxID=35708 RepID=A0A0A9D8R8_ARUDO